jgi:hypothetical protein
MTSVAEFRQRWTRLGWVTAFGAAVLLVVFAVWGVRTLEDSRAGRRATNLPPAVSLPATSAALVAIKADSGALTALVVFTKAPAATGEASKGGAIIPLPVGSGVRFGRNPSYSRLAELYLAGGLSELADQTGALLSVNFSVIAEMDASAVASMLLPLGQVSVKQGSGTQQVGPAAAATLLVEQQGRAESPHFESTVAYWNGLAARIGSGVAVQEQIGGGVIGKFFNSIAAGPVKVYPLRGAREPQGESNPTDSDVCALDAAQVARVMASVIPDAYSPIDATFIARVVNPFDDPALTIAAIERIRAVRGAVAIVEELTSDEASDRYRGFKVSKKTEFSLSGRLTRNDLKDFAPKFGSFSVVGAAKAGSVHQRYADIDITVVLGNDFRSLIQKGSS